MEAIQNYESDLSMSDEEDLACQGQVDEDSEQKETSCSKEKIEQDIAEKAVSNVNCDFFHLQKSESEDESQPDYKIRKVEKLEVIIGSGEKLSLPQSDFWEPLKTELKERKAKTHKHPAIQSNIHNFCYNYDSRSFDKINTNNKTRFEKLRQFKGSIKKSTGVSKEKIQCPDNCVEQVTSFQNEIVTSSSCSRMEDNSKSDVAVCLCNSNFSNRKLYEIHGKINAWLNRSDSTFCKVPRECEKSLKAHEGSINTLKWNIPKFSHLLSTVSMDTKVKIWNVWSSFDPCVRVLQIHHKGITDSDWAKSGRHILTSSYDKYAVVTDVETGQSVTSFSPRSHVTCGKFHPTNENIFLSGSLDELTAWDTRQNNGPIHTYNYKDKIGQVQDVIFNADGREFFSSGDLISRDSADRNIMAWDFDNAVVKSNQIYQERYSCTCLKLHPQDSNFLAQSHGNYIAIFSAVGPYKMCKSIRYEGHKLGGYKIGFDISPDGRYIVSGDSAGNIYNYDYRSGRLLKVLPTKLDINLNVAFHPVLPSTVACCGWNGFLEIWH